MACTNPFYLKKRESIVPCGHCGECRWALISGWSFRLMNQLKDSDNGMFLTLTYATEHLPYTDEGIPTLDPRDVTLFIKRLRKCNKQYHSKPLKYYLVGEYGGRFQRPHYHMLVFNCERSIVQDAWRNGKVHYGTVTTDSVGYTLKYLLKTREGWNQATPLMMRGRHKPFSRISKGVGLSYLYSMDNVLWHIADPATRMYAPLPGGKKGTLPRYYKDRLFTLKERNDMARLSFEKAVDEIVQKMSAWDYDPSADYRQRKERHKASQARIHALAMKH